jgi:glucose uptake protein GlcU
MNPINPSSPIPIPTPLPAGVNPTLFIILGVIIALVGVGLIVYGQTREKQENRKWVFTIAGLFDILIAGILIIVAAAALVRGNS